MTEIKASPGFDESTMAGLHWKCLLLPTRIPPNRDIPPLEVIEAEDRVELRLRAGRRYMLPGVIVCALFYSAFLSFFVILLVHQGRHEIAVGISLAGTCLSVMVIVAMVLLAPRARSADLVWASVKSSDTRAAESREPEATQGRVHGVRLVDCSIGWRNQRWRFRQLQVQVDCDGRLEWRLAAQSTWGLAGPGRAFASACGVGFEHLTIASTQELTPEDWQAHCNERLDEAGQALRE